MGEEGSIIQGCSLHGLGRPTLGGGKEMVLQKGKTSGKKERDGGHPVNGQRRRKGVTRSGELCLMEMKGSYGHAGGKLTLGEKTRDEGGKGTSIAGGGRP